MSTAQMSMLFAAPAPPHTASAQAESRSGWLGLVLEHRILLDALQDEWLRPTAGSTGFFLGMRSFLDAATEPPGIHRILVSVKLDPKLLPEIPVLRHQAGHWDRASVSGDDVDEAVVFWPGPIPTFAISGLFVRTDEERARLVGLTRHVSNVVLPVGINVAAGANAGVPLASLPELPLTGLVGIKLPHQIDSSRGAMTMAMWAVPRVDPWLDLLCCSLGDRNASMLSTSVEFLRSSWWNTPPWAPGRQTHHSVLSLQDRLWEAAVDVIQDCGGRQSSMEFVDRIISMTGVDASIDERTQLKIWSQDTISVLRGHARLTLLDWKANPVGKAIQLVLVRPDPTSFTKWKDDFPSLPPAVWWSGAALCGLLSGYRRLPSAFRGDPDQQRLFAIRALAHCGAAPDANNWNASIQGNPEWHRNSNDIVFSWAGTPFAKKTEKSRGQWFVAQLSQPSNQIAAEAISQSQRWPCLQTRVSVPAGTIDISGGAVIFDLAPRPHLSVATSTVFSFSANAVVDRVLDYNEFRRCVATEGDVIPPPPVPLVERKVSVVPVPRVSASRSAEDIPGLVYCAKFLTDVEEREVLAAIDAGEWRHDLKRRVQHFGWRYDYKSRAIDSSMHLGPLPPWAMSLATRLNTEGLLPHIPDQVIVNEYLGKQGISKHVDCVPCFDDGIAMISLLESWEMIFREARKGGRDRVPKLLEHGSVAVMSGDVRYRWSHEIPARVTEPSGLSRKRRVSVTFRKVNEGKVIRDPEASRRVPLRR